MEDEDYRNFLDAFYPVFFSSTLLFQLVTLHLIVFHTPKSMQALKYGLLNTLIGQVILITICFGCQFRMIPTPVSVYLRCYGLARYLRAHIAFSLHQILQFFVYSSTTSMVLTFYLKYRTILENNLTRNVLLKSYFVAYSSVFMSGAADIFVVAHEALPLEVQQQYAELNQNVTIYSTIGTLKLTTIASKYNFFFMCVSGFFYPLIGIYLRKRILHIINTKLMSVSEVRKTHHRQFVMGLTIQTIFPLVCNAPVFGLYIFCVTTHTEILFQQYFMLILIVFPALVDPIVTCQFVTPYRRQLLKYLNTPRTVKPASTTVTTI